MERLRDVFDHPHKLIVRGGWNHALHHKMANGPYDVAETEQEHCRGTSDEVFWREWLPSGKPCHDIGEQEGEAAHVLLGWPGSQEGTELAL